MSNPLPTQPVRSPCVLVCTLDENDVCLGCHRTLEEIDLWSRATEQQRREIVAACATRAADAGQQ